MVSERKKSQDRKQMLFNIGGGGMLLLGLVLAVKSSYTPKVDTPLCETRYSGGILFSYSRKGADPLSPEDLQARLAGTDRGLVKNASIVADRSVPQGYAMEVQLRRSTGEEDDQARSGIGFLWVPRQLALATSACLSYSVWIPEGFKLGEGGTLPGLVSDAQGMEDPPSAGDAASTAGSSPSGDAPALGKLPPFSLKPQWRGDGTLMLQPVVNIGQMGGIMVDPAKATLKPGQWSRIEEEVVLNTPGRTDGVLRAWVNGRLVVETFNVGFRRDENQSFQAVVGDIHHIRHGGWAPSPTETRLRISPLELRLK